MNMVAFDHVFTAFDLAAEQTNVADVMLCTAVMTASQMNIDGLVQLELTFQRLRNLQSVSLRVGCCELASGVSCTGDESGTE